MTDSKPRRPGAVPPASDKAPFLRLIPPALSAPAFFLPPVDAISAGLVWARRYRARLQLTDISVIMLAVGVALIVGFGGVDSVVPSLFHARSLSVSALVVATWVLALGVFHTRDSRVVGVGATEYRQVMNASALTFGLLAIGFLILEVDFARGYFLLALPIGVIGLLLERWLWRKWLLRQRRFGHYLARAIVVGNKEDVEYVIGQIDNKSGAAYFVVGAAVDSNQSNSNQVGSDHSASIAVGGHHVPVVSDVEHVAAAAASLGVDAVVVAGQPAGGSQFIRNLGWDLESTPAELVLSSRLTDVAGPRIHFRPVEGLPLIHVEIPHFDGVKHTLRRFVDLVMSTVALVLLSPLLLVIAVWIKRDSPGPVFFRQERCGRGGRTFHILKFRSMVASAEDDLAGLLDQNEAAGALFKLRNDPRVTRVGRVLRKYSLDELPQIWNILVGEMSVVGPRPPLPTEVETYETHVHRRLYIKPGLTGMWQVNGRSNLSWEDSVRLDLYYVENWSLAGDLMIIWRTVKTVVRPVGAY